jgi:hypothetical protein
VRTHALGEALEDLELAARERARLDRPRALLRGVRQVVEDRAQLARPEADVAGGLEQLLRGDGRALRVVREHVREADERGVAAGVVGVVALDR